MSTRSMKQYIHLYSVVSFVFVYQNAITIVFHSTFTLPVAPRNCVCSS